MHERQSANRTLQFSLAVVVMAVLGAVLLDRLLRLEEQAEKLAVELTVRHLRTALQWRQAALIVRGEEGQALSLVSSNPVGWLERPPPGYVGEVERIEPKRMVAGTWVYARSDGRLYYRPNLRRHLALSGGGELLAWQATMTGSPQRPGALRIEAAVTYDWQP